MEPTCIQDWARIFPDFFVGLILKTHMEPKAATILKLTIQPLSLTHYPSEGLVNHLHLRRESLLGVSYENKNEVRATQQLMGKEIKADYSLENIKTRN
jgi:hypothetical protein